MVFEQRARWVIGYDDALALRHFLHAPGWLKIDVLQLWQTIVRKRDDIGPDIVSETRRKSIRANDDHIDIDPVGALLRLDLAGQFRCRCFVKGKARYKRFLF
ncbi:hypothetical protein FQZ97_998760 [compost metagenome]